MPCVHEQKKYVQFKEGSGTQSIIWVKTNDPSKKKRATRAVPVTHTRQKATGKPEGFNLTGNLSLSWGSGLM